MAHSTVQTFETRNHDPACHDGVRTVTATVTRLRPAKWQATRDPQEEMAMQTPTFGMMRLPPDAAAVGAAPDHGGHYGAMTAGAAGVNAAALSRSAAVQAGDVAAGDLGDLLAAVRERLRRTVGTGTPLVRAQSLERTASLVQSGVLDCVSALDQIQTTLAHEMARRNALEQEIADTQAALADALSELAGTRAGERHALHLAQHDSLTSLPNRAYFLERLESELANLSGRRQAVAVLYMDLDDFKPINDRYGHDMGDELLRIVGIRLSRAVRADDMVCRLGGDEFGCLLADVNGHTQLGLLAGKLIDAISAPLKIGKRTLSVHASIGIAVSPTHGLSSDDLMRNADKAMYRAKRHQSGFAFFDAAQ